MIYVLCKIPVVVNIRLMGIILGPHNDFPAGEPFFCVAVGLQNDLVSLNLVLPSKIVRQKKKNLILEN